MTKLNTRPGSEGLFEWCDQCGTGESEVTLMHELGDYLICTACLMDGGYSKLEAAVRDNPSPLARSLYLPRRN
jgi:hypothetical protein